MEEKVSETSSETKTSQTTALEEEKVIVRTCFIPARKGSKRLPDKSKLKIAGKPLIWYTIKAAQRSKLFKDIIVTSDDEEILEIAYDARARLHKRPRELCSDRVQLKQVMRALLQIIAVGECFCLMPPCNPFVTAEDLIGGYELFKEKDANYVMSVVKSPILPEMLHRLKKGMIEPQKGLKRTQEYKPAYRHDGSFIFAKPDIFLLEFDWGFYGSKNYPYIIEHPSVDIDGEMDYNYARYLMRREK